MGIVQSILSPAELCVTTEYNRRHSLFK